MKIIKTVIAIAVSFVAVPLLIELCLRIFQAYVWIAETVFARQPNDAQIFAMFASLAFTMLAIISLMNLFPDEEETA